MSENQFTAVSRFKLFRNWFGHLRAEWRIFLYVASVVIFSKLLALLANSFLLIQGDHLGEYALSWNRLAGKSLHLLAVFLPGIVLLKWMDSSIFLRKSLFTYQPSRSFLLNGQDVASEIVLGLLLLALTIYLWKARWLHPAEANRRLWLRYPSKYGTGPETDEQVVSPLEMDGDTGATRLG